MNNPLNRITRSLRAFGRELRRHGQRNPIWRPHPRPRPKIGLALGGGFARGLAHIGVLKVLEEECIPIDLIAGTSVGSVIGAVYASGASAKDLADVAALVRLKDFSRWTISRFGLFSNDKMGSFLKKVLRCDTFEKLRIPLTVAATDILTGEPVVFSSGDLVEAVRASCAYPGMFQPVKSNGRTLVDGFLVHAVPATPLREMGAERVISVHLAADWLRPNGPRHVFDIIGQCFSIAQDKINGWRLASDIVLEPEIGEFSYDDFARAAEIVQAGERAARMALPKIREWLPVVKTGALSLPNPRSAAESSAQQSAVGGSST